MEAYWHDYQTLVRTYIFTDSMMCRSLQFSVSNYHGSSEIQTIILKSRAIETYHFRNKLNNVIEFNWKETEKTHKVKARHLVSGS